MAGRLRDAWGKPLTRCAGGQWSDRILASPFRTTATCAAITPVAHAVMSAVLEGRTVNLCDDYPAVLIGDPLLAVAAGLAAGVTTPPSLSRRASVAATAAWCAFGLVQAKAEYSQSVYTKRQILSPTKIWHQAVVYPTVGTLVPRALAAATVHAIRAGDSRDRVATGVAWVLAVGWAVTAVDAIRNPRLGHGELRWLRPARQPSPEPL